MGVRFLESFLENYSQTGCQEVYIPDMVREYKYRTGSVPVVVIDGMSCLRPLYRKFSWLNGGQYKEFYDLLQYFISSFTNLGCELFVFFDGPPPKIKLPMWKKRRLSSAEEVSNVFDTLDNGVVSAENNCRTSFLPNGLGSIFLYLMGINKQCKVMKSIKECDEEIARYALRKRCFAILAQDSDYVIYNSSAYYLSIKHFDLEKMTTLCYNRYNLSSDLRIHVDKLPLLASLVGNDIVLYESLRDFHNRLKRRFGGRNIITLVAKYIKNLNDYDLSHIAVQVFGERDKAELLWKSISSYDLRRAQENMKEESVICDKNWKRITCLAKDRFINSFNSASIYDIIVNNSFYSSTCLEDYRPHKIIVPVGNVLKELRRCTYGILLFEKPLEPGKTDNYVSELVMTGFDSMENFELVKPKYLEKVKHPGLIALWTSPSHHVQESRWEILGEIFRVETSALKSLPPFYLVPALASRYFKDQYPSLADWELDAIVAHNVCVKHYSSNDLAKLPVDPLIYRQIWIYTTVTRTYSTITNLLFYIGDPVDLKHLIPHLYTDGKLFHEKYRMSSKMPNPAQICEHKFLERSPNY